MKGRQDFSTDSIQRLIRKHQGAKPLDKKSKALLDPEEEEKEEKALLLALRQLVEDKKEEMEMTRENFGREIDAYYTVDKPPQGEVLLETSREKEPEPKRRGIITKAEILRNQNEKRKVFKSTLDKEVEKLSYFKKTRPMPLAKTTLTQDFAMDADFLTRIRELREEEQREVREREKIEKQRAKMNVNTCRNKSSEKVDVLSLAREALKWQRSDANIKDDRKSVKKQRPKLRPAFSV